MLSIVRVLWCKQAQGGVRVHGPVQRQLPRKSAIDRLDPHRSAAADGMSQSLHELDVTQRGGKARTSHDTAAVRNAGYCCRPASA